MVDKDMEYMREALLLADKAAFLGEVPVGAVIVQDGKIIAKGYNRRECDKNALRHAELSAIDEACRVLGGWRLPRCTLYVTLEPCPMCTGAIVNARIDRVVFGAYDKKAGACGSVLDLMAFPLNHKAQIEGGVLEEACAGKLKDFFLCLRKKRKTVKNVSDPETNNAGCASCTFKK